MIQFDRYSGIWHPIYTQKEVINVYQRDCIYRLMIRIFSSLLCGDNLIINWFPITREIIISIKI